MCDPILHSTRPRVPPTPHIATNKNPYVLGISPHVLISTLYKSIYPLVIFDTKRSKP